MKDHITYWGYGFRITYAGTPKSRLDWFLGTWRGALACWEISLRYAVRLAFVGEVPTSSAVCFCLANTLERLRETGEMQTHSR